MEKVEISQSVYLTNAKKNTEKVGEMGVLYRYVSSPQAGPIDFFS